MQGFVHHGRRWTVAAAAALLATGCSVYQPLDSGSRVPWASRQPIETHAGPVVVTSRPAASPQPAVGPGEYRVMRGDRLSTLAKRHGVSVRALAEANRLQSPYVIYVGQVLRVPQGGRPLAEPAERRDPPPIAILPDGRYQVRRGDTLSSIARRLDMPMTRLAALNDLPPPYRVYAGQLLQLPGNTIGQPAAATVVAGKGKAAAGGRQASPRPGGGPPALSGDGFLWPTNGKVVGKFGANDSGERLNGIDIAARKGAPVVAAENGVVVYAADGIRGYGRMLLIQHDQGYVTTYAHNAALLVEVGDVVARGQVVARVGDTGDVTTSQLHFELRKGSKPIDPEKRLSHDATTVASR